MFISNKKKKKLLNILAANQIIFNNFDRLDGIEKFEAYSQFTSNTVEAIDIIGDVDCLIEAQKYIFGDQQ